ncbi:major facilitator superfamily transporter [Microdochium trichocladiopsis]|uniref:Major facilitator superfamily transporter n=1 Tax=Microdochium trichocladiopsis TaxID=1682393 RepID=A0A9P9BX91_9PEZI|nr:major facilitator superfamily transporter [Microdochium trichocladiopsis]KAH7035851.1 major facilitator superfamily transporter [Microdochium trichocladiopsis]
MASAIEKQSPPLDATSDKHPESVGKQPSVEEPRHGQIVDGTYTPEEERQVLRKIDCVILPMMCFVFFMQYLDKQSLSYAAVFGLITDLKMTSVQYSWCSSIFYVGQLVAEYPFIYLMSKLPLTKFVGATVIIWGAVCLCLAAPQNFAGFAAVRFLLGFTEGAVSPAFVTMTSIWYQKSEHATRTALWVSMNGIAQVFGCLIMYGIGHNSSLALQPWRTMFLVCGAMTTFAGLLFYFLMPNGPKDAWFLTAREKEVLSLRMAKDRDGGDKTSFSTAQLSEALKDPKAWFVFWFGVLVTMQSPVLTFASLVINTIGYDKFQTMLYTAPSGAIQVVFLWIGVFLCWLFPRDRTLVVLVLIIPPLIGNVLLMKLSLNSGWGMIAASWMASCITAVMSPLLSLTASNVKGNTKRSVVSCMFFIGYCAGCIASPQLWTEKPRYFNGVVTALVTWCLLFVVVIAYRVVCQRDNARRDKAMAERGESLDDENSRRGGSGGAVVLDKNGLPKTDLTDKEDVYFRYSY